MNEWKGWTCSVRRAIALRWKLWRQQRLARRWLPELHAKALADLERQAARMRTMEQELARLWARERAEQDACVGGDAPALTEGAERLVLLTEACGATARAAAWTLRRGWLAPAPFGSLTNRVALERELGSLRSAINLMHDAGDVRGKEMMAWQQKYRQVLAETTRHQAPREG